MDLPRRRRPLPSAARHPARSATPGRSTPTRPASSSSGSAGRRACSASSTALAEDLRRRGRARRDHLDARRLGRGDRAFRHGRRWPGGGPGGGALADRPDRADPADGLGGQDRRAPACTSSPAKGSRWSGRPRPSRCSVSRSSKRASPAATGSSSSARRAPTCACSRPISGRRLGGGAHLRALRRVVGRVVPRSRGARARGRDARAGPSSRASSCATCRQRRRARGLARALGHGRAVERPALGVVGDGPWAVLDESGASRRRLRAASGSNASSPSSCCSRADGPRAVSGRAAGDE